MGSGAVVVSGNDASMAMAAGGVVEWSCFSIPAGIRGIGDDCDE